MRDGFRSTGAVGGFSSPGRALFVSPGEFADVADPARRRRLEGHADRIRSDPRYRTGRPGMRDSEETEAAVAAAALPWNLLDDSEPPH